MGTNVAVVVCASHQQTCKRTPDRFNHSECVQSIRPQHVQILGVV